jgi:hypothetical protein
MMGVERSSEEIAGGVATKGETFLNYHARTSHFRPRAEHRPLILHVILLDRPDCGPSFHQRLASSLDLSRRSLISEATDTLNALSTRANVSTAAKRTRNVDDVDQGSCNAPTWRDVCRNCKSGTSNVTLDRTRPPSSIGYVRW